MDTIEVRIDDSLRLAGALLAAGEWPDLEQKAKPYKPHRVAEAARKYFAPQSKHPAVRGSHALAGAGEGLSWFFGPWPPGAVSGFLPMLVSSAVTIAAGAIIALIGLMKLGDEEP